MFRGFVPFFLLLPLLDICAAQWTTRTGTAPGSGHQCPVRCPEASLALLVWFVSGPFRVAVTPFKLKVCAAVEGSPS